jgi:hypothetical protein
MTDEEKQGWDRQPRETSRSYELFCVYRNLGPERSLAKARESASGIPSVPRLKVLSRKWSWVGRSRAYDDYIERQRRQQNERERRQMNERQARIGVLAQNIVVRRMERLLAEVEKDIAEMTPSDLARLLDIGVKIERLARGEPRIEVEEEVNFDATILLRKICVAYGLPESVVPDR